MPGEALIQESVVRVQQIQGAAIFPDDAREQELCFALQREPQVTVPIREAEKIVEAESMQ